MGSHLVWIVWLATTLLAFLHPSNQAMHPITCKLLDWKPDSKPSLTLCERSNNVTSLVKVNFGNQRKFVFVYSTGHILIRDYNSNGFRNLNDQDMQCQFSLNPSASWNATLGSVALSKNVFMLYTIHEGTLSRIVMKINLFGQQRMFCDTPTCSFVDQIIVNPDPSMRGALFLAGTGYWEQQVWILYFLKSVQKQNIFCRSKVDFDFRLADTVCCQSDSEYLDELLSYHQPICLVRKKAFAHKFVTFDNNRNHMFDMIFNDIEHSKFDLLKTGTSYIYSMDSVVGCPHNVCGYTFFDAVEFSPFESKMIYVVGRFFYSFKTSNTLVSKNAPLSFWLPFVIDCVVFHPLHTLLIKEDQVFVHNPAYEDGRSLRRVDWQFGDKKNTIQAAFGTSRLLGLFDDYYLIMYSWNKNNLTTPLNRVATYLIMDYTTSVPMYSYAMLLQRKYDPEAEAYIKIYVDGKYGALEYLEYDIHAGNLSKAHIEKLFHKPTEYCAFIDPNF